MLVMAEDQQKAVSEALKNLERQQAQLDVVIANAREAVVEIKQAGQHSAAIIEKATRDAGEKGVSNALGSIRSETRTALAQTVKSAVDALESATANAGTAGEDLQAASTWLSWKAVIATGIVASALLVTVVGVSMLLVPSPNEIIDLRATVAALEAKGGKINMNLCGPKKQLCAEIDTEAVVWGKNSEFRILKGY